MAGTPTIALIAHDRMKPALVEWVTQNRQTLTRFRCVATGTTGTRILETVPDLDLQPMKSGPLGGDQQIGAMIAEGRLNALVFFADPMTPMPHDVDVKALLRLAMLYDLPTACNKATADLIITSPLFAPGA